ncbi:MAG: SpoIIE family protein phosphatase, partial [Desulfobulbaceae bacterium]|nr:SpoIIE family protein phosphatase [Desulfobulbaceae bacterium]
VCRLLKEDEATRDIPVIFITALKGADNTAKGFELGAVDYIAKPFDNAEIRARVKTHLALRHASEALKQQNALLHEVIAKQTMGIGLAKKILGLVNPAPPRYVALPGNLALCCEPLVAPCNAEGGDHFFVRTIDHGQRHGRTVISIKDQSGHEVECILRSILTDLTHNALLREEALPPETTMDRLNDAIFQADLFAADHFCTAMTAELDHATLTLRYVAAGHPPFLLIRGSTVTRLPQPGAPGGNLPLAALANTRYTAGEIALGPGDRLIFYTDGLTEMPQQRRQRTISSVELEQLVAGILHPWPDQPITGLVHQLLAAIALVSDQQVLASGNNSSADDVTLLGLELEAWENGREEVIAPASAADLDRLTAALYETMEPELLAHGYATPELRIAMPLTEAVINAWKHGNRQAADKSVTIRWRFGNDFVLEVIDQGNGFAPERVADPTARENLDKPAGRGIFIIRKFARFVQWRDNGRHLVLAFGKDPLPAEEKMLRKTAKLIHLW